jgi:outer membrane protein assembly factor BamB
LYAINSNGTLKWNYTTGSAVSITSPAIGSNGTIYIGCDDDNLYAINSNGAKKWIYHTGGAIETSPAIGNDGTIYFGSADDNLYAINPNGTQKWNYTTGGAIYSSPAIGNDGTIYFGSEDNNLYAINSNGTLKWKYITLQKVDSSLSIGSDDTIYVGGYDKNLYAINQDGSLEWTYTTGSIISSPAIGSNGVIYVGSIDKNLYAINPDGTKKWSYLAGSSIISSPAIGSDGTIYFGCNDHKMYALHSDGTQEWNYSTGSAIYSSPAIGNDGTIYFGSDDNNLYAVADITASTSIKGGYYNNPQSVALTTNEPGTIYYKKYIPNFSTVWNTYSNSAISITSSCSIEFFAKDLAGNTSPLYTQTYIIDTVPPTVSVSPTTGLYNTTKTVTLKMSEIGTIYYTLNGATPTTSSSKYTTPLIINKTTILKYLAVDLAGNKSPIYTQTYTIDKIPPKVSTTTPINLKTGVSRTSTIAIKFSENIKSSIYFNNITIKNLTTGKTVTISKSISGTILNIKTTANRTANTWYTVAIPKAAIKDYAGNNLAANYTFKFKTGT